MAGTPGYSRPFSRNDDAHAIIEEVTIVPIQSAQFGACGTEFLHGLVIFRGRLTSRIQESDAQESVQLWQLGQDRVKAAVLEIICI